ncbi:MAG: NAD-dependent epimerase/dehydratase family protein [Planctomycetota bacterium]
MSKHYLVTGGAGFIGSHLTAHLLEQGHTVTVLDNFSTGQRQNLEGLSGDLRVVEGSVTTAADVTRAAAGVAGIFHLAAVPSVVRSIEAPLESHEQNVTGTLNVLEAARQTGSKVVYAGSSSAYGDDQSEAKHEELREDPLSPYAATKLAGEIYCRVYSHVFGLPIVVTRFFNVFGPRQVPDSPYSGVVAAFCFSILKAGEGVRPRIDGDGSQSRDFTYVADVARGCRLAMDADLQGCHVVNLACGGRHSVSDLLGHLVEIAGVNVEALHAPPRTGDVQHSQADVARARELIGFAPEVSFREGLARTFDWYRSTYS